MVADPLPKFRIYLFLFEPMKYSGPGPFTPVFMRQTSCNVTQGRPELQSMLFPHGYRRVSVGIGGYRARSAKIK